MKHKSRISIAIIISFGLGFTLSVFLNRNAEKETTETQIEMSKPEIKETENKMQLGAFSMSLNVKDLQASKAFYETFGFEAFGGSEEYKYLIMK
ncbi:MAG: VOC family protein, partial [Desulfovibrionales bacterium]|nr:VOC family protein [Desulfovibrionales bacterium]